MPDQIDFPKCMFEGELRVLWELGEGSHGDVLLVEDSASNKFGVKTATAGSFTDKLLKHEYEVYQHLQCQKKKIAGLPQVFKYGLDHLHNKYVLVMSRLGASMKDVMKINNAPIPEYAALRIGCQLIRRLQYIHNMGIVHGDIKPRNVLCGYETFEKVYVVDFGLATFYKSMKSGKHHQMMRGQRFRGTEDFASRNAHKGLSLSRRDDMESLGYTLMYMMRGSLPWSTSALDEFRSLNAIAENEEMRDAHSLPIEKRNAAVMKERISIESLCAGLPHCVSTYMRYIYGLAFEESPDYSLLINMLEERMDQLRIMGDLDNGDELDIWTVPFEKSIFMMVRLEKEVWAELEAEGDAGEEENDVEADQEGEVKSKDIAIEQCEQGTNDELGTKDGKSTEDDVSCNPVHYVRRFKNRKATSAEDVDEGSELSALQPHPVLYRKRQNWWKNLLVFLRVQKPIPETVLLHYSDEGVEIEEQEW